MTISRNQILGSGIALAFVLAAGCGKTNSPTSPSTGTPPTILSLGPSALLPGPGSQTLAVTGANFLTGLTFTLRAPDGTSSNYVTISELTSTSFNVAVVLPVSGGWTASVKNADGQESTGALFTVAGAESAATPQIASVVPGTLTRNVFSQSFSINGQNFRAGATVSVTNPNGTEILTAVASQTDTTLQVSATFTTAGIYTVVVRNADGSSSGLYSLTVTP